MATTAAGAPPPSQTLYVQNLNDKIRKPDLRLSLYTLFASYGVVLDVVALKTMKCRGQAHVTFQNVPSATQALRALQGFNFFGKDMRIQYARSKSHYVAKLDGTFRIPQAQNAQDDGKPFVPLPGSEEGAGDAGAGEKKSPAEAVAGQKRAREEEDEGEKSEEEEAEMDVDDDD